MAKTYSVQIEKAQSLLKGIRMNYDKVSTLGITQTELRNLEHVTVEVYRINKELDSMRAAVSKKAADGSSSYRTASADTVFETYCKEKF